MQNSAASDTSGAVQKVDSGQEKNPVPREAAPPVHKQLLIAAVVAAAAFMAVLLLLSHAVHVSAPASAARSGSGIEKQTQIHNPKLIRIERLTQQFRTSAAGIPELEIRGLIRNSGRETINSADLKCRFRTRTGGETFLEIPLIVPTKLEDLEGGSLGPFSSREFGVRIGDFPSDLQPEILDAEPVKISFAKF